MKYKCNFKSRAWYCLIFLFAAPGCSNHLPPAAQATKTITINVTDFMHDCKSGDAVSGTSANDVNYTAYVYTYIQSGNSNNYPLYDSKAIPAPAGPDKSILTTQVTVGVNNTTRILVKIDASECSKCGYSFCNPSDNQNGFIVNAGKPYWLSDGYYPTLGSSLNIVPPVYPRNPNSPPDCPCIIKI